MRVPAKEEDSDGSETLSLGKTTSVGSAGKRVCVYTYTRGGRKK